MRTNTAGIDPGLKGAIALICSDGGTLLFDMPIYRKDKKNWIDVQSLFKILNAIRQECDSIYIEKVHSMPNQGVSSTFKFGKGFGILIGMCTALDFSVRLVTPQSWKKHFGIGRDKKQSIELANELFNVSIQSSKDGQAEALLIAEYGRVKKWEQ